MTMPHATTRPTGRRGVIAPLVAVLVAGLAISLAGCGAGASPEQVAANDDLARQIQKDLSAGSDYPGVEVSYVANPSESVKVFVEFRCDGCAFEQLADRAIEAVWTSEITPLDTIYVEAKPGQRETSVSLFADADRLEREYGPRPVSDDS
ncbi:hypothetical protein [Nocardioides acrostichi]|uniref:Uncharacterized protein n=1 Tax=Nocardioides acrostichi TaxID=2784339 RepID=A0A930UZI1_9ACTN|nr:hypothetical protein [Nocardioides acrostichi]MBF4161264.1 hypothetical protein [Nocardioides acrostichi]